MTLTLRPAAIRRGASAALAALWLLAASPLRSDDWPQWGRDARHGAAASVAAQPLAAILADFVYDPFVRQSTAESGGSLLAHYPVPLLDGPDVYMGAKTGTYVSCSPPGSRQPAPCGPAAWDRQIWNVQKLRWTGTSLAPVWRFETDWKPEPDAGSGPSGFFGWEPVFHPVLAGGFVYAPGRGGSIFRVEKATGNAVRISPFGGLDDSIFVAGGLAADAAGNVYYNAIQLDLARPWGSDARGGWLVQVRTDGTFRMATFASLVPGAPGASDACEGTFTGALPYPPSATAVPPTFPCGSQRPGINVVPAIAADGTVYTVSRAHFSQRRAYLVAADSSLSPRWSASLRDRLMDGCGVLLPPDGTPGGCRSGSIRGVDPLTNGPPAGGVIDLATSSPVALPDGGVLYGAYTNYNYSRGHLFHFDAQGGFVGAYDFGWDITPAVRTHDQTYSILLKDNHYETGSYCGDPNFCPTEAGRYDIVSLTPAMTPEWTFRNTNTESCVRQSDGSISCVSDHPDSFEWCVNQPAVDAGGVVYANSEDGFLYAIGPDGALRQKIFLNSALGAAYTPLSIAADGLVYTQNNGHLFAVGNPLRPAPLPPPRRRGPRVLGKTAAPAR
ncbi:MAG: hypothetical protein LC796_12255 [Acidobacteria bacterium]|nr:hypothetical protein [Acidobacteriota bacterium]